LFKIIAKGDLYEGAPHMVVYLDGEKMYEVDVDSTVPKEYGFQANIAKGKHNLKIAFTNDLWGGSSDKDRNLYVDKVVIKVSKIEERAMQIHKDAWDMVLKKAKTDNYYKYAIYMSRTLAVEHPEVYLGADDLFIKTISSNPGFQKAYFIRDVHSDYFYEKYMTGPSFSFNDVDFDNYTIIQTVELYPNGYPVLPFLDRRILPIASTLKSAKNELTQLEKAVQLYFKEKEKGVSSSALYLIYCDNENTYLYKNGKLIEMKNLREVNEVEGNPILIFNEKYVWYPLMDRDDASKDSTLKRIVERYSTNVKIPKLTDFEKETIEELKQVTDLNSDSQKLMATLSASRAWGYGGGFRAVSYGDIFRSEWNKLYSIPSQARRGVIHQLICFSNYLSPITAYLAAIATGYEGEAKINAISGEYLRYAATPGWSKAHGVLWAHIVDYTIEESYYAYAGACYVQAYNIASVLDILEIDNYVIEGLEPSSFLTGMWGAHHSVYIPEYDTIVSNGAVFHSVPTAQRYNTTLTYYSDDKPFSAISEISHNGKWALPVPDRYAGTLSPKEVIEILTYLKSVHNDEIKGVKDVGKEKVAISFEELVKKLEEEEKSWSPVVLP
jgi:hypothetical protein